MHALTMNISSGFKHCLNYKSLEEETLFQPIMDFSGKSYFAMFIGNYRKNVKIVESTLDYLSHNTN